MDAQGNLYKENPEWRKKMEKLKGNPFGFMAYGMNSRLNKTGKNKFGPDMPMESDRYIRMMEDLKPTSLESRSGYGKAKSYDPNRKV